MAQSPWGDIRGDRGDLSHLISGPARCRGEPLATLASVHIRRATAEPVPPGPRCGLDVKGGAVVSEGRPC